MKNIAAREMNVRNSPQLSLWSSFVHSGRTEGIKQLYGVSTMLQASQLSRIWYIYILFIYLFILSFIYFGCTGFSLLCELFSSFSEQDDSLGVVPGFLIAVASLAVKQELWSVGSIAVGHGFSCPRHVEYSRFSSVQLLICVRLFATPWTAARRASLSITNSQSPPKPMSIKLVMPSNRLILCRPLLLLPSIFPSIRVFSNESALRIRWPKFWSFRTRNLTCIGKWTLNHWANAEAITYIFFWKYLFIYSFLVALSLLHTGPFSSCCSSPWCCCRGEANCDSILELLLWLAFSCFCYYNIAKWSASESPALLSGC